MIPTANINAVANVIVFIGPFRSGFKFSEIYTALMDEDGAAGNGQITIQAAITQNEPSVLADVQGGIQLLGGPGGVLDHWIGQDGGTAVPFGSPFIPVDPEKDLSGKYLALSVTIIGAQISGWIGVR